MLSYFSDDGTLPVDWFSFGTSFYSSFLRKQPFLNRMPFSPDCVEENNQLHSLKRKDYKFIDHIWRKKKKKGNFSNFMFFLNAVDLWFQAVFRENPRFT